MDALDFVVIERCARRLHDEEVRRVFGKFFRALAQANSHFLNGLHRGRAQDGSKRYA